MASEGQQPWHSAFPTPSFDSKRISAAELVTVMKEKVSGKDYIVVDVRRSDFENAFIAGAVNLPAHSFYPTRQTATTLLSEIPLVVFHCQSCTPTGRGPRVAGWYAEELNRRGITSSKALVLDGGVKAFKDACCNGENADLVAALPNLS